VARRAGILVLLFAAALQPCIAQTPAPKAPDRVAELRSRFDHDPDPIRKAKLMPQLGDAEFREIEGDLLAERLPDALMILQQYSDEAQSCEKELEAKGVNAEQHPAGFKQLQFSLRESLRRLDDLLVTLTADERAPFEPVRKDIDEMNRRLIHELFPRQPAAEEPKSGNVK
jgi:hypothetical protein